MIGPLKDLLGHQAWADAAFFRVWAASGLLEDRDLRARAQHLVTVQEAFLQILKGEMPAPQEEAEVAFPDLKRRNQAVHGVFLALGRGLDEAALARSLQVPWFSDPPCVVTVSEALLQVCLHTQHHRGQGMARLRELGARPRNVDFIIWLWKQRPDAQWEG